MSHLVRASLWAAAALLLAPCFARPDGAADLAKLIHQMGSDEFAERDEARQALEKRGEDDLPTLRAAGKESKDAEVRRGLANVVNSIEGRLTKEAYAIVAEAGGRVLRVDGTKPVEADIRHTEALSVILTGTTFSDKDLRRLKWLGKVTTLNLSGTKVTDRGLAALDSLPDLGELRLSRTAVTDAGLASLKPLKDLRELDLSDTKVKGKGLEVLKNLKGLSVLLLDGCEVTDEGLADLKTLAQLRNLQVSRTKVADILIRQLGSSEFTEWQAAKQVLEKLGEDELSALRAAAKKSHPQVRQVLEGVVATIQGRLTKEAYAAIKKIGEEVFEFTREAGSGEPLYAVKLRGTAFTDKDVKHLKWLGVPIGGLNLSGTKITDCGIAALPAMPKLRELSFQDTAVTDEGVVRLLAKGSLVDMRQLNMMRTKVTGKSLIHLKGLKRLWQVHLEGCNVTDEDLVHTAPLKGLAGLNLSGGKITDKGAAHLAGLTGLTYLGLNRTKVTDAALTHFAEFKKLTRLDLQATSVTEKGAAELRRRLPQIEYMYGSHWAFIKVK